LKNLSILLVGDSCWDIFQYGKVNRICPEAPVPVFNPTYQTKNAGMAGNVFSNIVALDKDLMIRFSTNLLKPVKTRYIEEKSNHLIVRVDERDEIKEHFDINLLSEEDYEQFDMLVVSDYSKGFLTESDIFQLARKCPISFLDTKKPLSSFCFGYTYIKINEQEWNESVKHGCKGIDMWKNVIVTKGDKGCDLDGKNYPVEKTDIMDLSGAGDTFLAALVVEYLKSKDIEKAISFANATAGLVVKKRGVTTV